MTTLWRRITEGVDAGLAATLGAVRSASEKAAETTHLAQKKYERGALQTRIMRHFGELGSMIYEKVLREDVKNPIEDSQVQALVEKIKGMDRELAEIEAWLEKEKREKRESPGPKASGEAERATGTEAPEKTEPR